MHFSLIALLQKMRDIFDRKHPPLDHDTGSDDDEDSKEEVACPSGNSNYTKAEEEVSIFEGWKKKQYRPAFDRSRSRIVDGVDDDGKKHNILVGPVMSWGKDLSTGANLANYVDSRG